LNASRAFHGNKTNKGVAAADRYNISVRLGEIGGPLASVAETFIAHPIPVYISVSSSGALTVQGQQCEGACAALTGSSIDKNCVLAMG
jgi:hypothetical protein